MIDYIALEKALTDMRPGQLLYKLVKRILMRRGNWKDQPRGKPFKDGDDPRRIRSQHS